MESCRSDAMRLPKLVVKGQVKAKSFSAATCGLEPRAPVRSPGTSLKFQWLQASEAEGLGSILGQGTRSCMLQLRPRVVNLIN